MKITDLALEGVKLLEPTYYEDNRGNGSEVYSHRTLSSNGIHNIFVQDYYNLNVQKGTLRGIHYQNYPYAQAKIIRCLKGSILDIVVDLRKNSPTYKKWIKTNISMENKKQIFIPKGFGHGFVTLEEHTEAFYKMDEYYTPGFGGVILWNDPELGIDWEIDNPILSKKDIEAPKLNNSSINF